MRILAFLFLLINSGQVVFAQNTWRFGLQTGATMSKFSTSVNINITNSAALTIPPINEFTPTANFQVGCWIEKRINRMFALRWEVQRSPGGAKTNDVFEERLKRYKFFYLSSPIMLKLTSFQAKAKHPIEVEAGIMANLFLFDYGEDIIFGTINKLEYTALVGLTKAIDDKWSVHLRYLHSLTPFSEYDAGGVNISWTNQRYEISFSRALFSFGKKNI